MLNQADNYETSLNEFKYFNISNVNASVQSTISEYFNLGLENKQRRRAGLNSAVVE